MGHEAWLNKANMDIFCHFGWRKRVKKMLHSRIKPMTSCWLHVLSTNHRIMHGNLAHIKERNVNAFDLSSVAMLIQISFIFCCLRCCPCRSVRTHGNFQVCCLPCCPHGFAMNVNMPLLNWIILFLFVFYWFSIDAYGMQYTVTLALVLK